MSVIKDVLTEAQKTDTTSIRLTEKLTEHYKEVGLEEFFKEFTTALIYCLSYAEKNVYIDRTLKFITDFVAKLDTQQDKENIKESSDNVSSDLVDDDDEDDEIVDNELMIQTFRFLLKAQKSQEQVVRWRACQLISRLLESMGHEATIDNALFEDITKCLLKRMKDKSSIVRAQAVHGLSRLQDPGDKRCPIIDAYIFHLENDPVAEVRAAILECIATSSTTIGPIISRTRDVKEIVRRMAYEYLTKKVLIRCLTITQRIDILQAGMNDRSEEIRNYVHEKLIFAWLKQFDNKIVDFLGCLDIQMSSSLCKDILEIIFKKEEPIQLYTQFKNYVGDKILMPYEKLTCENAFYWQFLCTYLRKQKNAKAEECLEYLLPPLNEFTDYIRSYVLQTNMNLWDLEKRLEHEFVSHQLLTIASDIDLADQFGCQKFKDLVHDILLNDNIESAFIEPLLDCFTKLYPIPKQCLKELSSLVIELLDSQLPNANRDHDTSFVGANIDDLTQPHPVPLLSSKVDDSQVILKCLTIVAEMLEKLSFKKITPTHKYLIENLILPGIKREDPSIRNQSVRALGLCCLLRRKLAADHLMIFFGISQFDHAWIRVRALNAFFDIFLKYGRRNLLPQDSWYDPQTEGHDDLHPSCTLAQHKNIHTIFKALADLMKDYKIPELQIVVIEGFCKCLHTRRIYSPLLLSQLILLWFNPDMDDKADIKQILSKFFCLFAKFPVNLKCLELAFMPTLQELFNCLPSSSLAKIDAYKVIQFFLTLGNFHKKDDQTTLMVNHNNYAYQMAKEIAKHPKSPNVRVLAKALSSLHLLPHPSIFKLVNLSEKILEQATSQKKLLMKFRDNILEVYSKMSKDESQIAEMESPSDATVSPELSSPSPQTRNLDTTVASVGKKRALHDTTVTRRISNIMDSTLSKNVSFFSS